MEGDDNLDKKYSRLELTDEFVWGVELIELMTQSNKCNM